MTDQGIVRNWPILTAYVALDHRRSIVSSQAMSLGDSSRESTDKSKSRESLGVGLPPWIREIGDSMKSKKRELLSHATTLYASSTHTISALRPTTFNADMAAHSLDQLKSIFPTWDASTLQLMLEAHGYVMDDAITSLLQMEDETEQEHNMRQGWSSQSAASLPFAYVVKHPLPDDFLRVPGEGAMPSSPLHAPPMAAFDDVDEDIASTPLHPEDLTRQESSYAHDDGTVYGREFIDGDNMMMPPSSPTPMAIPIVVETCDPSPFARACEGDRRCPRTRRPLGRPNSRTDSLFAKLTVIKRSKLDIVSAEDRIRTREPHRLLDCLTKASGLYRSGLIGSDELENLRSMIVTRMSSKGHGGDATSTTSSTSGHNAMMITDHQWNCLVLKCKNLRHALSIRIIKAITTSQHTVYLR